METLDAVICGAFACIFLCPMVIYLLCITDLKKVFEKICNFFSIIFAVVMTAFGIGSAIWFFCVVFDLLFLQEPAQPEEPRISYSYEYQTEAPEPYFYDEYGIRYDLDEYSDGEYYISESQEIEIETPESSAFTYIGYQPYYRTLWVIFRNTGIAYYYYDVPPEVWYEFKTADSKGSYFQECIKGYYEYDRD